MTKEEKRQAWLDSGKHEFLEIVFRECKAHITYQADEGILILNYNGNRNIMTIKVDEMWKLPNLKNRIKKILALRW